MKDIWNNISHYKVNNNMMCLWNTVFSLWVKDGHSVRITRSTIFMLLEELFQKKHALNTEMFLVYVKKIWEWAEWQTEKIQYGLH